MTTRSAFRHWLHWRSRSFKKVLDAYHAGVEAGVFDDPDLAFVWAPVAEIIADVEATYFILAAGTDAERFDLYKKEIEQNGDAA